MSGHSCTLSVPTPARLLSTLSPSNSTTQTIIIHHHTYFYLYAIELLLRKQTNNTLKSHCKFNENRPSSCDKTYLHDLPFKMYNIEFKI